jgi:hypothetical protein
MPRDWGPWTVIKLDALERYFRAFTIASRKANRTLYLDLFGGRPENQVGTMVGCSTGRRSERPRPHRSSPGLWSVSSTGRPRLRNGPRWRKLPAAVPRC